jgi:ribosomal protein S18 acetylase RimI-like enzyme
MRTPRSNVYARWAHAIDRPSQGKSDRESGASLRSSSSAFDPIDGLVETYLAYARALPPHGTDHVHSDPDLAWGATAVDLAVVNRVMRPKNGPTGDRIRAIIEHFDNAGVSSSWWLDDRSTQSGLTETLLRAGYAGPEAITAMMLDLRALPIMEPIPQVELVYATDRREMADAQALAMRGFGTRSRKADHLGSQLASLADPDTGIRTVVARYMDQPVATATAVVVGSTVGLYSIATLPAARGMGFGRAVTLEVLRDAWTRGVRQAVLESTPMGRPMYESLGFRSDGTFLVLQRPAGGRSLLSRVRRRFRRA